MADVELLDAELEAAIREARAQLRLLEKAAAARLRDSKRVSGTDAAILPFAEAKYAGRGPGEIEVTKWDNGSISLHVDFEDRNEWGFEYGGVTRDDLIDFAAAILVAFH